MTKGEGYDALWSLWDIQESLLQNYRALFITVESIILAVAAGFAVSIPVAVLPLALLGFWLVYVWREVTSNRAKDVSFVQWMIGHCECGHHIEQPLVTFKAFQAGRLVSVGPYTTWRHYPKPHPDVPRLDPPSWTDLSRPSADVKEPSPAREKLGKFLWRFFMVMWVALLILAVVTWLGQLDTK